MILIACLGNPGATYQKTRHNIGYRVGQLMCQEWSLPSPKTKFHGLLSDGIVHQKKVSVLLPTTFMNLSGRSVLAALQFYKMTPSNLWVIYDDFDIPFGTFRFRQNGSAGTHNGMRSIIQEIGTTDFPRLRIGIGPKPDHGSISDFVLSPFSDAEEKSLGAILTEAINHMDRFLSLPT